MDIDRAYEREQDEIDRRLANGEITGTEHRKQSRDLREGYEEAQREETEKILRAQAEWEKERYEP